MLRQCCRATDTAARYGGDEFMLILPETDIRGAEEVATRIRRQMATLAVEAVPGLACTVSLGAAEADARSPTSRSGFSRPTPRSIARRPPAATGSLQRVS